ncbi:DUF6215 domain-containing protein [Streptomyces sp. NPDC048349]|uniref:DUF6215 domain-containing protein n=1 Tax=Streptomyces sp. NPDC048349 TaxID=3155486 RepID=UPI00344231BA
MTEDNDAPNRGAAAWRQAATALLLVPALGFGLWLWGDAQGNTPASGSEQRPVTCVDGDPGKQTPHLSGKQLCETLYRPDLADLLGTPGQRAKSAGGGNGVVRIGSSGKEVATPSARVEFETYTVTLSATYGSLTVATSAKLLGDGAPPRTVLGRPAAFYSDRTIRIGFRPGGSDSGSSAGLPARVLMVAQDAQDGGNTYEVTLWRADGAVPDDAVVLRVAEAVLPTLPGWTP